MQIKNIFYALMWLTESRYNHLKEFEFNLHLFAIKEFEIIYEDTCRQRILSDTRLVILR